MRARRGLERREDLCSGPGKLTQALGIELDLNGSDLVRGPIAIEPPPADWPPIELIAGPRIGITKAAGAAVALLRGGLPLGLAAVAAGAARPVAPRRARPSRPPVGVGRRRGAAGGRGPAVVGRGRPASGRCSAGGMSSCCSGSGAGFVGACSVSPPPLVPARRGVRSGAGAAWRGRGRGAGHRRGARGGVRASLASLISFGGSMLR